MAKVVYTVSQRAADRLRVRATITPDAPVNVLTLRDAYGPAGGFATGIANLVVGGTDARAAVEPGRILVAASKPFTLAYDCVLPDYEDAVSMLRGFRRGGALFAPGMALFHRLHADARYDVLFDTPDVRSIGLSAIDGRFVCETATDLERAYFAVGDIVTRACGRTLFVHERGFAFALDELLGVWPRLMDEAERLLGEAHAGDWTALLFTSPEHPPGRPGAGFALPRGTLVSVSAEDDALATSHTLWLLLHERIHQWLGRAIGRASQADDWFFEGFTNFLTCEALQRAGRLPRPVLARLVALSRRAVREADASIEPARAHRGFLAARHWDVLLARQNHGVAAVLTRLLAARGGEVLDGAGLLLALAQASPDGQVPDFVRALAADG